MDANPGVRKSAPYGHACLGCSKAKCKCISRGGGAGDPCERCHRLSKACQPSVVVRKGPPRRAAAAAASNHRTAQLEEKLESLVTLLQARSSEPPRASTAARAPDVGGNALATGDTHSSSEVSGSNNNGSSSSGNNNNSNNSGGGGGAACFTTPSDVPRSTAIPSRPASTTTSTSPSFLPGASSLYASSTPTTVSSIYLGTPPELPSDESDRILETFQHHHLATFPFVYLPHGIRAWQLQQERPCLWMSIRIVCSTSSLEKSNLDTQFRAYIAQRTLVDADRDLDLLLGLLAWLTWMMDRNKEKKTLCAYVSLACSLAFDLRLDRADGNEYPCRETNPAFAYSYPIKPKLSHPGRTFEERRAVLACYAISVSIQDFLRTPPMRWTVHMDDSLQLLLSAPECSGDRVLGAITQVQRVNDEALSIMAPRLLEVESGRSPKVPAVLYVKPLLAKLDEVKQSLPPELLEHRIVRSYVLCVEASINEFALAHVYGKSTALSETLVGRKTECFFACLSATKGLLENWLSFTTEECYGMNMMVPIHFARATHILYRLSITDDPTWDRHVARNSIDLFAVMEKAADVFSSVAKERGIEKDDGNLFVKGATALRVAIPMWQRAFAECDAASASTAAARGEVNSTQQDTEERNNASIGAIAAQGLAPIDFSDNSWMDLVANWEMQ